MLEELTAEQWAEWISFYALEPWGFDVKDGFNAILCNAVARAFGAETTPKDFLIGPKMPGREGEEEQAAPVDLHDHVKQLFGHKDAKGPPRRGG